MSAIGVVVIGIGNLSTNYLLAGATGADSSTFTTGGVETSAADVETGFESTDGAAATGFSPDEAGATGVRSTGGIVDGAGVGVFTPGMIIFWPARRLVGLAILFSAAISRIGTPYFFAIWLKPSPGLTMCSTLPNGATTGVGAATGLAEGAETVVEDAVELGVAAGSVRSCPTRTVSLFI